MGEWWACQRPQLPRQPLLHSRRPQSAQQPVPGPLSIRPFHDGATTHHPAYSRRATPAAALGTTQAFKEPSSQPRGWCTSATYQLSGAECAGRGRTRLEIIHLGDVGSADAERRAICEGKIGKGEAAAGALPTGPESVLAEARGKNQTARVQVGQPMPVQAEGLGGALTSWLSRGQATLV